MKDQKNAIEVAGIGKQYVLGGAEQHYDSFRDMLGGLLTSPIRKFKRLSGNSGIEGGSDAAVSQGTGDELFWALKGIDFEIPEGQITGVIGRNGAGKSTLLKVLSRITSPTTGKATIKGRVASLLEVGSGFHPELTGRENIFMNASILGMRRQEVHRKLDDIVEFAEVERFLDTPVKRYSSGMYVRLAFSVAAHVDPDVLLVDEVLAVGDAKFQKRCIGKLSEVGQQGRTVMFVSHNMGLIQDLCTHTIYLKDGGVSDYGPTGLVLPKYLQDGADKEGEWLADAPEQVLRHACMNDESGQIVQSVGYKQNLSAQICFRPNRADADFVIALRVSDELGRDVLSSWDTDSIQRSTKPGESFRATCQLPSALLRPGRYFLTVMARNMKHGYIENIEEVSIQFNVTNVEFPMHEGRLGVVLPILDWSCQQDSSGRA